MFADRRHLLSKSGQKPYTPRTPIQIIIGLQTYVLGVGLPYNSTYNSLDTSTLTKHSRKHCEALYESLIQTLIKVSPWRGEFLEHTFASAHCPWLKRSSGHFQTVCLDVFGLEGAMAVPVAGFSRFLGSEFGYCKDYFMAFLQGFRLKARGTVLRT